MAIYYGDGTNSEGGSTGGRIIQVTQNGYNTTQSANINAGSIWESTGLDVTLTPKDSTNKILIMASIHIAVTGPQNNQGIILRKGTGGSYSTLTAANAAAAGSRMTLIGAQSLNSDAQIANIHFNYLDVGGSTNATTYRCDVYNPSSIQRLTYINRAINEPDSAYSARAASWIIAMEVANT